MLADFLNAVLLAFVRAPKRGLMGLVKAYRLFLSPWLGSTCRFEPTCSVYALQALDRHGAAVGSYLAVHRLGRCHPWCAGGCDPVPSEHPALFTHLPGFRAAPPINENKPS